MSRSRCIPVARTTGNAPTTLPTARARLDLHTTSWQAQRAGRRACKALSSLADPRRPDHSTSGGSRSNRQRSIASRRSGELRRTRTERRSRGASLIPAFSPPGRTDASPQRRTAASSHGRTSVPEGPKRSTPSRRLRSRDRMRNSSILGHRFLNRTVAPPQSRAKNPPTMATRKKTAAKKRTTRRKPAAKKLNSKSDQIRALLNTGVAPVDIAKKAGSSLPLAYQVRGASKRKKTAKGSRTRRSKVTPPASAASVLAAVQQVERDRERMRTAPERMHAIVADALT